MREVPTISTASKILLVLNDEILEGRIDSAFKKVGFEVITASDGHQALKILYGSEPDLVIMAENIVPINGDKLYSRIRQLSHLPIIVLGDSDDIILGVRALVEGVDSYLAAPIHLNELIARTRALLRRYKQRFADARTGE